MSHLLYIGAGWAGSAAFYEKINFVALYREGTG
jgi:hypothetical protein